MIAADAIISEGTFEVTGGNTPVKARYLNTLVRKDDRWRIASIANVR